MKQMMTGNKMIKVVNRLTVSEIRISYRPKIRAKERAVVTKAATAYQLFLNNWDMDLICLQEESWLMLINANSNVLGIVHLSKGGMTTTVIDPRMVFLYALHAGATGFIIAHNHPSGGLIPSKNDEVVTGKLKEAGKLLGIQLLDHLIVTVYGYYSMAENALI